MSKENQGHSEFLTVAKLTTSALITDGMGDMKPSTNWFAISQGQWSRGSSYLDVVRVVVSVP